MSVHKDAMERIRVVKGLMGDDLFANPEPSQRTVELARTVLKTLAAPFWKKVLNNVPSHEDSDLSTLVFRAYIAYAWAMVEPRLSPSEISEAVEGMFLNQWTSYVCGLPRHVANEMPHAKLLLDVWDMVLRMHPFSKIQTTALVRLLKCSPANVIREWLENDQELGPDGISTGVRRAQILTWISLSRTPSSSLLRGLLNSRAYDLPAVIEWVGWTITSSLSNGAVGVALDFASQIFSSWDNENATPLRLKHIDRLLVGFIQHARSTELNADDLSNTPIYATRYRLKSVCILTHALGSNRLLHLMRISKFFTILAERTPAIGGNSPCFSDNSLMANVLIVSYMLTIQADRLRDANAEDTNYFVANTMRSVIRYFQMFFAAIRRGTHEIMSFQEMVDIICLRVSFLKLQRLFTPACLSRSLRAIYVFAITGLRGPAEAHPATTEARATLLIKIDTNDRLQGLCAICLEELSIPALRVKTCQHIYHNTCLNQWLNLTDTCPTCRNKIIVVY